MFLSPALQALVEDWPHRAARLVAEFRVHSCVMPKIRRRAR
jgi:hypothetical protein